MTRRRRPGIRALCASALAILALQAAPAATLANVAQTAPGSSAPRRLTLLAAGQVVARVHLRYRGSQTAALVAAGALRVAYSPGQRPAIGIEGVPADLAGPLPRGAGVGRAVARRAGRTVAEVGLVTRRAIPAATLGQRLRDFLSRALTIVALVVLLGCSLLLAILRARATRRQPARRERTAGSETAA